MPEIVNRLQLSVPQFDLFSSLSLFMALAASLILLFFLIYKTSCIFRLSIITAALVNIFFQWPIFIISDVLESSLKEPYWYFFSVQFCVFSLLFYGWITSPWLSTNYVPQKLEINRLYLAFPVFLSVILFGVYMRTVPFDCTALFAVMFDPHVTLLAREVSIKLAGSYIATASYGALVNAVAPVVLSISIGMIYISVRRMKLLPVLGFSILIIFTVFICLVSGAKGLLFPSVIVILAASLLWNKKPFMKGAAVVASILVLLTALVAFEQVRERGKATEGAYPFGQCSMELGACSQSKQLIISMYARASSLGISSDRLDDLRAELEATCGLIKLEEILQSEQAAKHQTRPRSAPVESAHFEGIIYRALVIPTQVAAWHFLYVEEMGSPGLAAMPLWRHLMGSSLNMPELVYQKYGSIFSGGDRTSTSTSPTSFILTYPAYLGVIGLGLVLLALIATDVITSLLLRFLPNPIYPIGVGLLGAMAYNFILSDFITVIFTHGGGVAIALIAFFALSNDKDGAKRVFDFVISLCFLIIFAIPALILAFAIRIKLGSPVLFKQPRPGRNGKIFTMFKFRTMTQERSLEGVLLPDAERLTPFGKWLRATSLDELPELLNVIRGEMSLVGPRPLLIDYLPLYTPDQARRHEVRPGITGWAQINGRNALSWEEKFAHDVWYVDNRSLWLDIKILFRTVERVVRRDGITAEGSATVVRFEGGKKTDER